MSEEPTPDLDAAGPPETLSGQQSHDSAIPAALRAFMAQGWARPPAVAPEPAPWAPYTAKRRAALRALFPDDALVIPSGTLKVRANDTDYPFRPGSDFYWLTGEQGEDAVLMLRPGTAADEDAAATLYVHPRSDRSTSAFYADRRYGELWVGPRSGLAETAAVCGIDTGSLADLPAVLAELAGARVLRGYDAAVDAAITTPEPTVAEAALSAAAAGEVDEPAADDERELPRTPDEELAVALSELRLIKDDHEIAMLSEAIAATVRGFEDVVRELPWAIETSERWIEGTFDRRARVEGNDVGYGSICACGPHATTLHWVRNDGAVRPGELMLLDMGVESHELYTADVTRTLPISGRWSPVQRQVYDVVYRAQSAAIEAVRPGVDFLAPHRVAMRIIAEALAEWGILPVSVEEALEKTSGVYQRYTLHGTSHMLGLDVHDCGQARSEQYRDGKLAPGMVLTVEPGLYFQPDDLTVPEHLRGIGVRIEDDILVTDTGCRNLSGALPRDAADIERWMAGLHAAG
jgi:Xaa-Pro aminopeptidase